MTGLSHVGVWVNPAFKLYGFENGKDYLLPVSYGIIGQLQYGTSCQLQLQFFPLNRRNVRLCHTAGKYGFKIIFLGCIVIYIIYFSVFSHHKCQDCVKKSKYHNIFDQIPRY